MNRDFLKGLGLESEAINAIMARHGSVIADKETEITTLTDTNKDLTKEVDDLKAGGDETLKEDLAAVNKDKEALEIEIADLKRTHALEKLVTGLGTNDNQYVVDKLSDLEYKDGEFIGYEERVKELKEAHPLVFPADDPDKGGNKDKLPKPPKPWSQGNSAVNTGGGEWTKDKIMEVKDVKKRQQLIRENRDLF